MAKIRKPTPGQGKRVTVPESATDTLSKINHPIFCFRYLDKEYNLESCDEKQKLAFLDQLFQLSQRTWIDIQLTRKHGAGSEKIATHSIKAALPPFLTSDVDHLLSFRFYGLMPFLGHRSGPILHIIFIDPKGKVYNH